MEMAMARGMLDELHGRLPNASDDPFEYTLGRIGPHSVAIACLPRDATLFPSAEIGIPSTLSTFPLRFGLMVGIGGGVPSSENDIRLGDVVVSDPNESHGGVIQYDLGKQVEQGSFTRIRNLDKPPAVLIKAVSKMQSKYLTEGTALTARISELAARYPKMYATIGYPGHENDQLFEAGYDHPGNETSCEYCDTNQLITRPNRTGNEPCIHYGLIASGNWVMRHGGTRERLRREMDVLCFEMDATGLMNSFPCLVIRGICDYADSHKTELWQPYAAATAAAYTKELLLMIPEAEMQDQDYFAKPTSLQAASIQGPNEEVMTQLQAGADVNVLEQPLFPAQVPPGAHIKDLVHTLGTSNSLKIAEAEIEEANVIVHGEDPSGTNYEERQNRIGPPTDSGYASMAQYREANEEFEGDDGATVMSNNEELYIPQEPKETLVNAFADGLCHDVGPLVLDSRDISTIFELLPTILKEFSIRIRHAAVEKTHTDAISFVRQNRK
jgi:nucleoside phosphorylase